MVHQVQGISFRCSYPSRKTTVMGHLGRQWKEYTVHPGTREAAGCFQRPLQQSRLIKILRPSPAVNSKEKKRHPADTNSASLGARNWPKCVFTQVTNWAGKAACFRQLMRAKSQTSVGVFKS